MIGTLPYFPIPTGQERDAGLWEHLNEANKERAVSIADSLIGVLSPLAQITSKSTLQDSLRTRVSFFGQLQTELLELLWPTLESLKEQRGNLHEAARRIILSKADLLGEEATQALLGAIESDESLTEWVIRVNEQGPYYLDALIQQASMTGFYSAMCINSMMGILTDQITDWVPEAIPVLAEAADDYMTEVEDVFLAQSSGDDESEEIVNFDSLRKDLGL